jgi:hypothetical protein
MKHSYSQMMNCDVESALKMFCNPAYHPKIQAAMGALDVKQLAHSDDGTQFSIRIGYNAKSSVPLPGPAKKILGETTPTVQVESWNRKTRTGEIKLEVKALPGSIQCRTSLKDEGGKCRKTFEWEVKVKIPLIGGMLENLIIDEIKRKDPIERAAYDKLLPEFR